MLYFWPVGWEEVPCAVAELVLHMCWLDWYVPAVWYGCCPILLENIFSTVEEGILIFFFFQSDFTVSVSKVSYYGTSELLLTSKQLLITTDTVVGFSLVSYPKYFYWSLKVLFCPVLFTKRYLCNTAAWECVCMEEMEKNKGEKAVLLCFITFCI